ncbi:MAG: hypothetical protein ACLRWH_04955 [Emergencia sp.]
MEFTADGLLHIHCDCRIPVTINPEEIHSRILERIQDTAYRFTLLGAEKALYVPKDSLLVTTLMNAYRKVTGDMDSQPMASGGATYSRAIENCVAFGCLLPDQKDTMHQADESLEISRLKTWLSICTEAIYQLAK